jgi:tRNA pseudouridine38-40 synthase
MRNIKLVLEYDGTDLCGWQRQENGPSVQQHLEEALAEMIGAPVAVAGASRTDAGVHARGQVASFQTEAAIPLDGFRRGLNGLLPPSIAVVDAEQVPADFHARFSARAKHYRYSILARRDRSPLAARFAWHRGPRSLDLEAMRQGATHLVGEHDFSAFRAAGCSAKTTIREVTEITIDSMPDGLLNLNVHGNAFLRNMVRIVAGTLVAIGEGRIAAAELTEILTGRDRERAGPTAPPHGLALMRVFY